MVKIGLEEKVIKSGKVYKNDDNHLFLLELLNGALIPLLCRVNPSHYDIGTVDPITLEKFNYFFCGNIEISPNRRFVHLNHQGREEVKYIEKLDGYIYSIPIEDSENFVRDFSLVHSMIQNMNSLSLNIYRKETIQDSRAEIISFRMDEQFYELQLSNGIIITSNNYKGLEEVSDLNYSIRVLKSGKIMFYFKKHPISKLTEEQCR